MFGNQGVQEEVQDRVRIDQILKWLPCSHRNMVFQDLYSHGEHPLCHILGI